MLFLVNPKHRKASRKRGKRKPPKGFSSWKAYMASIRPSRTKAKKGADTMAKKRSRKHRKTRKHRKSSRRIFSFNPPKRRRSHRRKSVSHRRKYRGNPRVSLTPTGIVNASLNGVVDAAEIVVGKAVARTIPPLIGVPTAGLMGMLVQVLTAVVVGWAGNRFVSPNAGKMMLAGALVSPIEDLIKGAGIPYLSTALGEGVVELPPDHYSAYPQLSAYPESTQMGDYETEAAYIQ